MITVTSQNEKMRVVFQGDAGSGGHWNGYTLSRSMLRIERLDSATVSSVLVEYSPIPNVGVSYYTDPSGVLEIPVKNFLQRNAAGGSLVISIYMYEMDGSMLVASIETQTVDIMQGVSYYDLLAPRKKDTPNYLYENRHDLILPPNVMISPNVSGQMMPGVLVESNATTIDGDAEWSQGSGGVETPIAPSGPRGNRLVVVAPSDELVLRTGKNSETVRRWNMERVDGCIDLVCIRWTSLTGCMRQHFFPIVGFINAVDKEVSVIEAGNGYDVRKNAYKGVHCRLTGLTAYGCWYYQDLLQASDAHAIVMQTFSTFATEIESMETACHVTGGMEETPQGNGFYNFDFTVKLRHYDTV